VTALEGLYARTVQEHMGFFDEAGLAYVAARDPFRPVLIRWHEGRAIVSAQDARRFIELGKRGGWVVRDVSLPAGDPAYRLYSRVAS